MTTPYGQGPQQPYGQPGQPPAAVRPGAASARMGSRSPTASSPTAHLRWATPRRPAA